MFLPPLNIFFSSPLWRHQMETFSALLDICAGNSSVTGEFPAQRPVTRSFDAFFDLRPNKRLNKQWWGWWFETPSRSLWRYCNDPWLYHTLRYCFLTTIQQTVIFWWTSLMHPPPRLVKPYLSTYLIHYWSTPFRPPTKHVAVINEESRINVLEKSYS